MTAISDLTILAARLQDRVVLETTWKTITMVAGRFIVSTIRDAFQVAKDAFVGHDEIHEETGSVAQDRMEEMG